MYVGGQYVGLGEGDVSDEVAKITDFILLKWDRFDALLRPHNRLFTTDLKNTIAELQGIYKASIALLVVRDVRRITQVERRVRR